MDLPHHRVVIVEVRVMDNLRVVMGVHLLQVGMEAHLDLPREDTEEVDTMKIMVGVTFRVHHPGDNMMIVTHQETATEEIGEVMVPQETGE